VKSNPRSWMAVAINKAVALWIERKEKNILILPQNVKKVLSTITGERGKPHLPQQPVLGVLSDFMQRTDTFKTNQSFSQLWLYLSSNSALTTYISELKFVKTRKIQPVDSEGREVQLKFTDTLIIYKDRDILQSFCLNSKMPTQFAMATTRGIREIIVNENQRIEMDDEDETHTPKAEWRESVDNDHNSGNFSLQSSTSSLPNSHGDRVDIIKSDSSHDLSPLSKIRAHMGRSDSSVGLATIGNFIQKHAGKKMASTHLVSKQVDHNIIVQWLESHPVYSYYLSGGIDGSICLWQFNAPKENALMATYRLPPNPRVNRIHFNSKGTKFGACDMVGNLALWRFEANEASLQPFQTIQCNTKRTQDFTFLNASSVLATAGVSSDKRNINLWDTLLPPDRMSICSYMGHEGGASSIQYSSRHQALISGGKKGDIIIFDIRQQRVMESVKAHTMNVKSLTLSPEEDFVVSGSNEGNVKVWSLPSLTCVESWDDIHSKHTFVRKPGGAFTAAVSTYGVMQVMLTQENLYSCGSDGRILRFTYDKSFPE